MANHGMTPEELALLTEEERAGLEDDELVDEGDETTEDDDTGTDDADDGNDGDEGAGDADGDDNAGDDDKGDDDSGKQDDAGDDDQPGRDDGADDQAATTSQPVPLIRAELPADFDDQVKAITDRRAEIRTERRSLTDKYEDGDLTSKEYHDALDKLEDELSDLNDKRYELKRLEEKVQLAQEMNRNQVETRWYTTVETFLGEHPEITKNQTLVTVYDQIVQRVTAETMKAGKEPGLADLQKAYKQWAEDLGITPQKPAKEEGKQPGKQEQKPAKQTRNVPPTLGKVPAADTTSTEDGKWAWLDRLADSNPEKYEAEIAKLSEAEFDQYSNS